MIFPKCTSSEYTPKINRRLSEGFRSYPNSPVFFKACFFFQFKTTPKIFPKSVRALNILRRLTENCPRVSEVTRIALNFQGLFFSIQNDSEDISEEYTSSE